MPPTQYSASRWRNRPKPALPSGEAADHVDAAVAEVPVGVVPREEGKGKMVLLPVVRPDAAGHHRGHHVHDPLVEVQPFPGRSRNVDVRELHGGQADDEARPVDERQGPGVVVDGREVLDPADEDALGQLPDGPVAVGPVVRVLCRGRVRPRERGEQGCRR